ncbi:hypothetical protein [Azohydromonas aeria]|uniref:hypothetical protein n=1 Tax=Azohydromonas aeria TaxID=2590212 RepID=UPI0012FB4F4D|nr:hypothetical protein [Azohydromonas aeria]
MNTMQSTRKLQQLGWLLLIRLASVASALKLVMRIGDEKPPSATIYLLAGSWKKRKHVENRS